MAEIEVPAAAMEEYGIARQGLTLIQHPVSPFCIAISAVLDAAGVPYSNHQVQIWDRRPVIAVTRGHYYAIPVLVDAGEPAPIAVYEYRDDAQDIARYLDAKFGLRLFPQDLSGLHELIVQYVEGQVEDVGFRLNDAYFLPSLPDVVERTMYVRHKERKFGKGCVEQWLAQRDELQARLAEVLTPLEQMVGHHPYLLGDHPVFADFALYGVLGNYTYTGHNAVPESLPNLRRWRERVRQARLR
jgi:glutathione S-transferase